MRKGTGRRQPQPDFNQLAQHLVKATTDEPGPVAAPNSSEISRVMAEMGRRGGLIGGKRGEANMTEEERSNAAAFGSAGTLEEKEGPGNARVRLGRGPIPVLVTD